MNTTGVKLCCDVSLYPLLNQCSPIARAVRLLRRMLRGRGQRESGSEKSLRILHDAFLSLHMSVLALRACLRDAQWRIFVLGKISTMTEFFQEFCIQYMPFYQQCNFIRKLPFSYIYRTKLFRNGTCPKIIKIGQIRIFEFSTWDWGWILPNQTTEIVTWHWFFVFYLDRRCRSI